LISFSFCKIHNQNDIYSVLDNALGPQFKIFKEIHHILIELKLNFKPTNNAENAYKELTHISKIRNRKRDKLRSQLTKIKN